MMLGELQDVRLVGSADPAEVPPFETVDIDVLVVDAASETGVEVVRRLRRSDQNAKVVAIGVPENEDIVITLVEAGVSGFVFNSEGVQTLIEAIIMAVRGQVRFSPRITAVLVRRLSALATIQQPAHAGGHLTRRELEIVGLIDEGLSNKEIARALWIEVATVKNHVHHILEKLQVSRRGEAAARVRAELSENHIDHIALFQTRDRRERVVNPGIQSTHARS